MRVSAKVRCKCNACKCNACKCNEGECEVCGCASVRCVGVRWAGLGYWVVTGCTLLVTGSLAYGRMYALYARLRHRPSRCISRAGTPSCAAEVAAPIRRLWVLKFAATNPARWSCRWMWWRQVGGVRGVPSLKQNSGVVCSSGRGRRRRYAASAA